MRGKQKVEVLHGVDLDIAAGEFLALMGPSGLGQDHDAESDRRARSADERRSASSAGDRIDQLSRAALVRLARAPHRLHFPVLQPAAGADRGSQRRSAVAAHQSVAQRSAASACRRRCSWSVSPIARKHKPNELSGGQQQRVAIARAIVADPTLLVCDEPTGDLDRQNAEEIMNLLQALNRTQGKTIVMVTHDPKAAEYASRELHLDKGRLVDEAARRAA